MRHALARLTRLFCITAALQFLAGDATATELTSYPFSNTLNYVVSDPGLIEVRDGVAKLIRQPEIRADGTFEDYLGPGETNVTTTGVEFGVDSILRLQKSGGAFVASGGFTSRVIDGGIGNTWNELHASLGNFELLTDPTIVRWYRFEGDFIDELTGDPATGQSVTFSADAIRGRQSLRFSNGGVFTVPGSPFAGLTAVTVTGWWKQNTVEGGLLWGYFNLSKFHGAREVPGDPRVFFRIKETGLFGPAFPTGEWTFWVFIWDGIAGRMKIYLNGALVVDGSGNTGVLTQDEEMAMGFNRFGENTLNGNVDDFQVYNRVLSETEIAQLYVSSPRAVEFRVRSGSSTNLTGGFIGPNGTPASFYSADHSRLVTISNFNTADQYAQYQVTIKSSDDRTESPVLDGVGLFGSRVQATDNTLDDFQRGSLANLAATPATRETPFLGLSRRSDGGFHSHGVYTSPVLDFGLASPFYERLSWQSWGEASTAEDGLRALWAFNSTFGESTGQGPVLVPTAVEFYPYPKGGSGSARFDGSSSRAVAGDVGEGVKGVEFWINTDVEDGGILELVDDASYLSILQRRVVAAGFGEHQIIVNGRAGFPRLRDGWNHVAVLAVEGIDATSVTLGEANGSFFEGLLDDVALYKDREVEVQVIKQHYVEGRRFAGGDVKFQVRTGSEIPITNQWIGQTGADDFFTGGASGSSLGVVPKLRYLQFRAFFEGDGSAAPIVTEIEIDSDASNAVLNTVGDFLNGNFDGKRISIYGDELKREDLAAVGPRNILPASAITLGGLWHFDEAVWSGAGAVLDAVAGRNGTPSGDAFGGGQPKVGLGCAVMDGDGDYITVPPLNTAGENFSVSAWFRTASSARAAVVSSYAASSAYFTLEVNGNGASSLPGAVAFVLGDGTVSIAAVSADLGVADDEWHHLVGVRQGPHIHVFLDGERVASASVGAGFTGGGSGAVFFGKYGSQDIYFSGSIDEVAIFLVDDALSAGAVGDYAGIGFDSRTPAATYTSEVIDAGKPAIWSDMFWGGNGSFGLPIQPGVTAEETDEETLSLKHLWRMDNSWADSALGSTLPPGTPFGSVSFDSVGPKVGGFAGQFVNGSVSLGNAGPGIRTVEFWILDPGANDGVMDLSGSARLNISGGNVVSSGLTLDAVYVNGERTNRLAQGWSHVVVVASANFSASAVVIGQATGNPNPLTASLDELALYTRVVGQAEAKRRYVDQLAFQGLVGLWPMDEAAGTNRVHDSTGQQAPGVVNGAVGGSGGKYGSAVRFNGSTDFIQVSDSPLFDSSTLSVLAWVDPDDVVESVVFGKRDGADGDGYALGIDSSGRPYFMVNGTAATAPLPIVSNYRSGTVLPSGPFVHLAGTYDTRYVRIFVDGQLSAVVPLAGADVDTVQSARFGRAHDSTREFGGRIDELAVYRRALTSTEVFDIYAHGVVTLRFQARTSNSLPLTGSFLGPDGTSGTYFTDARGNDLQASIPRGQYFQYKVDFATEDYRVTPRLQGVYVDISAFPDSVPTVENAIPQTFVGNTLGFTQILQSIEGDAAVEYQITGDATNWYYYDTGEGVWTNAPGLGFGLDTTPWNVVNDHMFEFFQQLYPKTGGDFRFRAHLFSDGDDQVEIDQIDFVYSAGALTLTFPNGEEVDDDALLIGVDYNIEWVSRGIVSDNLTIEYSDDGGTNWTGITTGHPNSGVYSNWTIPGGADVGFNNDRMVIRISDADDPSISDVSDSNFEIRWEFKVITPNGGEKWYIGSTTDIVWDAAINLAQVRINLLNFADTNSVITNLVAGFAPSLGPARGVTFSWDIPTREEAMLTEQAKILVRQLPNVGNDLSDEYFTLAGTFISDPESSDALKVREPFDILWTASGAGSNVTIELSRTGVGGPFEIIATNVPNVTGTNSYLWDVDVEPSTGAVLRITSEDDPLVTGLSEFFVLADINILEPVAPDSWLLGSTNTIKWQSAGAGPLVDVFWTTNENAAEPDWIQIADDFTNEDAPVTNELDFLVPPFPGDFAGIRVESVLDPSNLFGVSRFTIGGIRISDPNGNEFRDIFVEQDVIWDAKSVGQAGLLDISYDGGVTWTSALPPGLETIGIGLLGNGVAVPHAPQTPSVRALYRMTSKDDASTIFSNTFDVSDNFFTTRGILPASPTNNQQITLGTTNPVSWISAGAVDPLGEARVFYAGDGSNFDDLLFKTFNNQAFPGQNVFQWIVDQFLEPSTTARLRIESGTGLETVFGITDPFTVRGILFTDPVSNSIVRIGGTHLVEWTDAGFDAQAIGSIFLSQDNGATFDPVPINTDPLNPTFKSFDWDPVATNAVPTDTAILKWTITNSPAAVDVGYTSVTRPFTLQGLQVIEPDSADNWALRSTNDISFLIAGADGNVRIEYSPNGGLFYDLTPVLDSVSFPNGSNVYSWAVEQTRQPSTNARIRVTAGSLQDVSDVFTIRGIKPTSPTGFDIWAAGETNIISWIGIGIDGTNSIEAIVDGTNIVPVATGVVGNTYEWFVPIAAVSSNVVIRITDTSGTFGDSESFTIVPAPVIEISSPDDGDFFKVGQSREVKWFRGGNMINDFSVLFTVFPFVSTNEITPGPGITFDETNNSYSVLWPQVPNQIAPAKMIVKHNVRPELIDVTDFFISPNYSVVAPNGGETNIFALKPQGVIWNTLGGPIQSDVYYSLDPDRDPSSWVKINTAPIDDSGNSATVPGINVLPSWTPPNVISTSAWLRVQHADFTNMFAVDVEGPFDDTDDPFSILYFTILWHVMDATTSNDLDKLSVIDSSGWSDSGLTGDVFNVSGEDIHLISRAYPFGTFDTEWSREFFFNEVIFQWDSQPSRIIEVFMTPSEIEPNYEVFADFSFNTVTRSFSIRSWLERGGELLQTPDSSTVTVYDDTGAIIETISTTTSVQGFFLQTWDVAQTELDLGTTFSSTDIFPAKVDIQFADVTYSAGVTFQLRLSAAQELEGVIDAATSNILAAVEGVDTNVLGVASNVSDLSDQVAVGFAGVNSKLDGLSNQVEAIAGANTGLTAALQSSIDFLTNEAVTVWTPSLTGLAQDVSVIADDVRSDLAHILNRSTTVQLGDTVDILYKTRSGYPNVSIIVSNDALGQVYGSTMSEIPGTGIYEDRVTFDDGEGVFQVVCADQMESDRIIISVVTTNDPFVITIGQLSNQLANIESVVTNLSADFDLLDIMTGQLSEVTETVSNIDITVAQNLSELKIDMSNVVEATDALTNQLAGLEALAGITGELDLFAELGSNLQEVAQSGILGLATSVSNIDLKTQFLTNDIYLLALAASNLNQKADITTNSLTGLQAIPDLTGTLAQIDVFTSNLQLLLNSNIDELGTNITDILGMTRGLTNEILALSTATNQLDAVIGIASNVQTISQVGFNDVQISLSNLQAAIDISTNQLDGLAGLTGSLDVLSLLVTNLDVIIDSGIANMATELSNLVVKTDIVTNQLDGIEGLANITGKLDVIENLTSNLNDVLDTGLLTFATSVSNIEVHTTILTNLMQGLGVVTGDLDTLTLLVESNVQLFADTGIGALATSVSNIDARTVLITGSIDNLDVSISTISNQLSGLEGLAGITSVDFSVLGGLSSNLQALIDSGVVGLAESVSNIEAGMEITTNQLSGLDTLDTLNSNIQSLLGTGIGDLASSVSNINQKVDVTTNQLAVLGTLTNLDLSALGGIASNLQGLVDSGLVDLASLVSNIAVGVDLATNQLAGLDELAGLSNVLPAVGNLNSNLQDLLATGVGDLAGSVSNIEIAVNSTTNQISALSTLTNLDFSALGGISSNLQGLVDSGLVDLASLVSNIAVGVELATNQLEGLDQLGNLSNVVVAVGGLNSNLQDLLATGIGDLAGTVSNIDQTVQIVTNQLDVFGTLTNLDFSALGGISSNLQGLIDSGIVDLASLVSNISDGVELATNQLAGLDQLSDLSNVVVAVGGLNSNLQDLLATGIGDLSGAVSNIDQKADITTNQLAIIGTLTNLDLSALGGISSNLQSLVDSGLVDLASLVSNIAVGVDLATNQLEGLDQLSDLSNVVVSVGGLNSNLQDLLATGVGDLAGNVSNLLELGVSTTNQLDGLASALGVTGTLDGITDVLSNLNALASGELTGLASNLVTLVDQTSDLTNQITGLSELSDLPAVVSNATEALADVATAVSNTSASLDGAVTSVTNIENIVVDADFAALATIATLSVDVTAIKDVTDTIVWDDVNTIITELAALSTQGATNEELIRGTSNLVAVLEARLGVEGDDASVDTVFGRLAALDEALALVGEDAAQARKDVRTAKSSASAASAGINVLKESIGSADVETAIGLFDQMASNIDEIVESVRNIETGIAQGQLASKMDDIAKQLGVIAEQSQLDPKKLGIPDLSEIITTQQKDIVELQNSIEQLQGAMRLMQELLEKETTKPVVSTILLSGSGGP